MAFEILENNSGEQQLILAGIRESGSVIARNIQRQLKEIAGDRVVTRLISIALDKRSPGEVTLSTNPCLSDDQVIIVIDDVANSGSDPPVRDETVPGFPPPENRVPRPCGAQS